MSINWSESQLEVINADDSRILVSASAGSGKTTVMIQRILRLLKSGVKISNMLICTFTKASAADMRAKLYAEMSRCGLKSELKDLSRADICTIDSFCQRLVSAYFYILGIDPQFEVLDEAESAAIRNDAVEQSIIKFKSDIAFNELYGILLKKRRSGTLKKAIISLMEFKSINPDTPPSYNYDEAEIAEYIRKTLDSERQKTLQAIQNLFDVVDEPEFYAELISALKSGNCTFERRKLKKENSQFKPCIDYLKDKVKDYAALKAEIENLRLQSESRAYIEALINAADYAAEIYSAEKIKRSTVDFSDLENMALVILNSDVLSEIKKKYKYVFVDEYQDINPLQENIIERIADGNNLFMVGDLKQSIYAFRGCEPRIFKQKYDIYRQGKGGRVISLDTNYRSGKNVINFVNKVFSEIMTDEFGGVDYKHNPMSAASGEDGFVKFHIVTGSEKSDVHGIYSVKDHTEPPIGRTEAEATLIAYRITELLKLTDDGKPTSFGDIAILTRSMGTLESLVVLKLRQINVPVTLKEDAYFLDRPETGQLIAYLRLIDNRLDDKAMAIAMLSPFGGFSEDELAKIRLCGDGSFYECVTGSGDDKVRAFFDKLDRYYALSLKLGVDELADIIVSECGYFNYVFGLGEDAAEVLDKFLEFLGTCPQKNSLKACLDFIDERNPYAELSCAENSVKLMTIHKSKGLEFKYVFVIGLGEPFNLKDIGRQIFAGANVAMCVYDNHEALNSDLRFITARRELKKQLEEELRILYVAFTRAQKGLELFASMSDSDKVIPAYEAQPSKVVDLTECTTALKWLAPQVYWATKYDIDDIEVEEASPRTVLFGAADRAVVEKLKDYFGFIVPNNVPAKSYVSKLAHNEDEDEAAVYIVAEPQEGGALERGNAYHRAMEKLDFSAPMPEILPDDDVKLIDINKLLVAAKKMSGFVGTVYKEKPFMIKLTAQEAGMEGNGNVLVQGVIDLLIINGDEATIVDYKTGKAHGSFEEGYFKQVNLYALAVERLLKKNVTGKFLYYFDSETFVEIK